MKRNYLSSANITTFLGFLGLYLIATGASWVLFTKVLSTQDGGLSPINTEGGISSVRSQLEQDLPKTEICPINGGKFTKVEKKIWEERRPITAMIENSVDSRPQSGISKADVVYEIVAEGGITRFMGVFYCGVAALDTEIAPVRSARIYFVNIAGEYGDKPLFTHVGGANGICSNCPGGSKSYAAVAKEVRAIEHLVSLGWRVPGGNDFDTTYDLGYPVFWRNYERLDHPVATEHTMMSSSDRIYEAATKRNLTNKDSKGVAWDEKFVSWQFMDDKPASSPTAEEISFMFWDNKPDYDVKWQYDKTNNRYLRFNGGQAHTDLNNKEQISAKNVVIMFLKEKGPVDKELHMFYQTIGEGEAMIFQNGEVIEGTWEKASANTRTKFFDDKGKEISFVRGTIWIEGVPTGNDIEYN